LTTQSKPLFPEGGALVAGGSGGIGSVICKVLAQGGANVFLTYRRSREKAEAAADLVRAAGRRAEIAQVELEDTELVAQCVAAAVEAFGNLHTVVYAAGPYVPQIHMSRIPPADVKAYLLNDSLACYNLIYAALPFVREVKGSFIALTTAAMTRWSPKDALSVIPKAAVEAMVRGVAREEGRFGVRANVVEVGWIKAGQHHAGIERGEVDQAWMQAAERNIALRRIGEAEEIANAVVFLASSRAAYVTGESIRVDGGFAL